MDGRTRQLQGDYDEVAGYQQRRPAELELQGQACRPGDQDGFSVGLICHHPTIGVPANDMLHVRATSQARKNPYRIMSIDVRRAYFYAKARPVYIENPIEDFDQCDEGKVA